VLHQFRFPIVDAINNAASSGAFRDFPVIQEKASIILSTERNPLQRKYLAVVGLTSLMAQKDYDSARKVFEKILSKGDIHLDFLKSTARYHIKKQTHTPSATYDGNIMKRACSLTLKQLFNISAGISISVAFSNVLFPSPCSSALMLR